MSEKRIIVVGSLADEKMIKVREMAELHSITVEFVDLKEGETEPYALAMGFNPNPPEITMPFVMSPYLSVLDDIRPYMYEGLVTTVNHGKSLSKHARNATKEELDAPKVGRNELCPCGSNLKFKKCHGK